MRGTGRSLPLTPHRRGSTFRHYRITRCAGSVISVTSRVNDSSAGDRRLTKGVSDALLTGVKLAPRAGKDTKDGGCIVMSCASRQALAACWPRTALLRRGAVVGVAEK